MTMSRRSLVKSVAWSAPTVVVATAAPAFAASPPASPECSPIGYKKPGLGHNTKDYFVLPGCDPRSPVVSVHIDGQRAQEMKSGYWALVGQRDSRNFRLVLITFADGTHWQGQVAFPPRAGRR